jgi:L-ascorbate metabolism protein UlaG (beta-lactamase superfamily)
MKNLSLTWLGHSTFLFRTPAGRRLIVDPWIKTNPACPDSVKDVGALDLMLLTHGHGDHTGDAVSVARSSNAQVVAPFELSVFLQKKGLQKVTGMNPGGTLHALGLSVTMVSAVHSSSIDDDGQTVYAGLATGYVVTFENDLTIYIAGDTSVFGDMRLIGELYRPAVAFLPIGDLYTMGPREAAKAVELLNVSRVVPMHYGTFPALTGTPGELRRLVGHKGVDVIEVSPGVEHELA